MTEEPSEASKAPPAEGRKARWASTWLSGLSRVVAFGFGVGLALALVAGVWQWYAHRPRPWNSSAVTARPVRAYVADAITFVVQYRVRNNTDRDLRIRLRNPDLSWRVFERGFRGLTALMGGDTPGGNSAVDPPQLFLPPGEEVGLSVQTIVLLNPDDSRAEIVEELRGVKFGGFVIYDTDSHLRVDLPFSESVIQAK